MLTLSMVACFPGQPKHQRYAKLTEGGFLVGGIAILAVANTGADCDMMARLPGENADCKSSAGFQGGIGLAMILAGLVGFAATVATAEPPKSSATSTSPTPTPIATEPTKATDTKPTPIATEPK